MRAHFAPRSYVTTQASSTAIPRGAQLSNASQPSVQVIPHRLIVVLIDLFHLRVIEPAGGIVEPADGREHVTHGGQSVPVQP